MIPLGRLLPQYLLPNRYQTEKSDTRKRPGFNNYIRSIFGLDYPLTNSDLVANHELCQYLNDLRRSRKMKKLYYELVQLLDTEYSSTHVSPISVQHLVNLLGDFPELLVRLSDFLPLGYRLKLSDNFERTRIGFIIKDDKILSIPAAFGLIDTDVNIKGSQEADIHFRHLLITALNKEEWEEAIFTLRGDDARCALLQMHELSNSVSSWYELTRGFPRSEVFAFHGPKWKQMRRLLVELAAHSNQVPQCIQLARLRIGYLDIVEDNPVSCIYEGWVGGQRVAAKRFKVFCGIWEAESLPLRKILYQGALKWKQLEHRRLLPFLGLHHAVDVCKYPAYFALSPWAPHGNVRQCMDSLQKLGTLAPRDRWITQIAEGLMYLHESGIVHGALRGSNILVDKDYEVMLADFDTWHLRIARICHLSGYEPDETSWLAPEAFTFLDDTGLIDSSTIEYTPCYATDIYEFASVCVEIYSNSDPRFKGFKDRPRYQYYPRYRCYSSQPLEKAILRGERPVRPEALASDDLWALMGHCWSTQARDRPSIQDVVETLNQIFPQTSPAACKV